MKKKNHKKKTSYKPSKKDAFAINNSRSFTSVDNKAAKRVITSSNTYTLEDIKIALPYSYTDEEVLANIKDMIPVGKYYELKSSITKKEESTKTRVKVSTQNGVNTVTKTPAKKQSHKRWSPEELDILKKYYPVIPNDEETWEKLLPGRSLSKIKNQANYRKIDILKDGKNAFTQDEIKTVFEKHEELGTNPAKWVDVLPQLHTEKDFKKLIATFEKRIEIKDATPEAPAKTHNEPAEFNPTPLPKARPVTDAPAKSFAESVKEYEDSLKIKQEEAATYNKPVQNEIEVPTMEKNATITNDQLFKKLIELSETENVKVKVDINFGNGLIFRLPVEEEKPYSYNNHNNNYRNNNKYNNK